MRASFAVTEWEECSLLWSTVRLFLSPDVPFVYDTMEESQLLVVLQSITRSEEEQDTMNTLEGESGIHLSGSESTSHTQKRKISSPPLQCRATSRYVLVTESEQLRQLSVDVS